MSCHRRSDLNKREEYYKSLRKNKCNNCNHYKIQIPGVWCKIYEAKPIPTPVNCIYWKEIKQ